MPTHTAQRGHAQIDEDKAQDVALPWRERSIFGQRTDRCPVSGAPSRRLFVFFERSTTR